MARVTGNLELDGTTLKLKQGQANPQSLVAGSPTVPGQQVRLPNESDTLTELITANSGGDATKRVKFDTTTQTTGTTLTIQTSQTTSQTLTIPNLTAPDTIVTVNAGLTLDNKTLEDPTIKTGSAEFGLRVAGSTTSSDLLTIDLDGASRDLTLGGDLTTDNDVTLNGDAGGSNVTLPASGTLLSMVSNVATLPNTGAAQIALAASGTLTLASSITELIIAGDLTVNGTTTTINSTNLAVTDKNITVNFGGNNAGLSVGDPAGITVEDGITDGTDSRLVWNNTSKRFEAGQSGSEDELTLNTASQTLTNKTFDTTSNVVLKGGNTDGATLTFGTNDDQAVVIEQNNTARVTLPADQAVDGDLVVAGSGAMTVPVGDTAARPSTPTDGMFRYNSETLSFEGYKNSVWGPLGGGSGAGGINYIANSDAEDTTTTGWFSGSFITSINYDNTTNTDTTNDTFNITAHGLIDGTEIIIGTKPGAIDITGNPDSSDTRIKAFVVNATANTFQIAWTKGGAAADITSIVPGNFKIYKRIVDASLSPTFGPTFTNTATNPVRGARSFLFTKDTNNRDDQFISYPFTIDPADTGKQLTIAFDYFTSAAYTANDVRVRILDVNAETTVFNKNVFDWNYQDAFITPAVTNLPKFEGTASAYNFKTSFVSTTSTQYELILEVNTATTTSFTLTLDNIRVGPDELFQSSPVTEEVSYTPVFENFGTVTSIDLKWSRVGSRLYAQGRFNPGTSTASLATISLPPGLTIDFTKVSANTIVGNWQRNSTVSGIAKRGVVITNVVTNKLYFSFAETNTTISPFTSSNGNDIAIPGIIMAIDFSVPIAEWAGSTVSVDNTQVEYAYSTTAFNDSDDLNPANTGYGPEGAAFAAVNLTDQRKRRIRFLTPIQPTDDLDIQVSSDGGKSFLSVAKGNVLGVTGFSLPRWTSVDGNSGLNTHGIGFNIINANDGTIDVRFGKEFFIATDTTPTFGWATEVNSNYRWRVVKSRNPLTVGGLTASRWQTKSLITDVTTAPLDITALQFNNLEIGKFYRVTAQIFAGQNTTTNSSIDMSWYSGAGGTGTWYDNFRVGRTGPSWTAGSGDSRYSYSFIFTATSNTLFTRMSDINGMYLYAEASGRGTRITLEELPLHSQTSQWT